MKTPLEDKVVQVLKVEDGLETSVSFGDKEIAGEEPQVVVPWDDS